MNNPQLFLILFGLSLVSLSAQEEAEPVLSNTAQELLEFIAPPEEDFLWQAFIQVERAPFIPNRYGSLSQGIGEIRLADGTTILSPIQVYHLFHSLNLDERDKLLLIGNETDYEAAILEKTGLAAFRILDYTGQNDSSLLRWQGAAPFQAILVTQGVPRIPPQVLNQLDEGGVAIVRLISPSGIQQWLRIQKVGLSFQMDLLNPDGSAD